MIGKLRGILETVTTDYLLIDVGGICYIVYCSSVVLSKLKQGDEVALFIEMSVKEQAIVLYGFLTISEKECFQLLVSVQGIGGRLALSILGALTPHLMISAIQQKNCSVFEAIAGIGKKMAARIIGELSSKKQIAQWLVGEAVSAQQHSIAVEQNTKIQDSISALVNLGFNKPRVIAVVESLIVAAPDTLLEDLIKKSLAILMH